jgi:CheY-like chemotaxis protein
MKKILIVDDEVINRKLTISYLEQLGYDLNSIDEAENGEEAKEKLDKNHYDLLLLDIYMPNMDGIELLDWIKKDGRFKDLKIVVITTDDKLKREIESRGVDKFIVRPIDLNKFVANIAEFIIE